MNRTRKRLFFCLFLDNFTRIFLSPEHIDWNKNFSFEKKNLHFIKFPFYLSSNELDLQHILCLNEHCTFKCIPYKSNDFIYSFPFSKINELKRKKNDEHKFKPISVLKTKLETISIRCLITPKLYSLLSHFVYFGYLFLFFAIQSIYVLASLERNFCIQINLNKENMTV